MTIEHTKRPEWDIDIRENIYNHLRASVRARVPEESLWHINEAIALLYVARCPGDGKEAL